MQRLRWLRQAALPVSWQSEKNAHDIDQPHDDQNNRACPIKSTSDADIVIGHMHQRVHPAQDNKTPSESDKEEIGVVRHDLKDRQHIEKDGQLELVGKRICKLTGAHGPVRLAQRDLLESSFAAL